MKSPKKDTKRKVAAFIALFLAFLMILGAIAPFLYGAEISSKASVSAQVGYSGLYKVGYPTPIWVEVKTGDTSFDGEILIRVPYSNNNYNSYGNIEEEQYMDYAYPLTMNANEIKNVELEVNMQTLVRSNKLKVELVDKKGNIVVSSSSFGTGVSELTAYVPENMLVATLSDNPVELSYIKGIYYDGWMKNYSVKKIVDFNIDNFPDNFSALSAFNIIYINDFDTSRLSNMSKDALKSWVNGGGLLYIGTGENYAKTMKGLENIINIENTERISTSDLEGLFADYDAQIYWVTEEETPTKWPSYVPDNKDSANNNEENKGNENKDSENSPESEAGEKRSIKTPHSDEKTSANPIILELPVLGKTDNAIATSLYSAINTGQGKIVLYPFSLSEAAVQKSSRFVELLTRVAEKEVTDSVGNGYIGSNLGVAPIVSTYNLASIPYQSEGITRIISILVILYIVAVGPVLYFILRKKDKKEAGFVIIPVVALSVTVVIFVMSLNTIYKRPVLNEVSLINVQQGERYAVKNSNIAVLTGKKGDVAVRMDNHGLNLNPFAGNDYYGYGYYGYGNFKPIKVIYGDQPGITYYDNERWAANVFSVTEEVDLQEGITADIVLQNGVYMGVITNNTPYDLKEVVLSFGIRGYKKIGDINAGEEFIINDDLQDKDSLHYNMYSILWNYDETYNQRPENDEEQVQGWRRMMYRYIVENSINNARYSSSYYGSSYSSYQQYTPLSASKVTMYAYIGDNMGSVNGTISGATPISFHNNAVVMEVECKFVFDSKGYDLPFGFVSVSEIRADSYYDANMDYGIYTDMNDEIEFVYDLSDYENLQSFMFSSNMENNTYGEPVYVEIYNCKLDQWEELNYKEYQASGDYISETSELIIRVDCRKLGHVNFPEIQLKGGSR